MLSIMTTRDKIILFTAIFIIFLLAIIVLLRARSTGPGPASKPTPTVVVIPSLPDTLTPRPSPSSETISIKGISMENFYKDAIHVNRAGDVLITNTARYQLVYQQEGERFLISVNESPYEQVQKEAEQALLSRLGISADDACWIGVFVSSPYYANPDEAGIVYNPTFCEHD